MVVAEGQFVGMLVRKIFEGHGMYEGAVLAYDPLRRLYNIGLIDGDLKEMAHTDVLETILFQEEQMHLDGNAVE